MTIFGKDGVNMNTKGSSGIDIITGGSGLDTIKGKQGNIIKGGSGDDT